MSDEAKQMWMERFALGRLGDKHATQEQREAWIKEFDALPQDERETLQEELNKLNNRAAEIVDEMVVLCDTVAGDIVRGWGETKPDVDLQRGVYILLYRLVAGHNHSIAGLPAAMEDLSMSARALLAGDAKNREMLVSIDAKLGTLCHHLEESNKLNTRVVEGLIALYKQGQGRS